MQGIKILTSPHGERLACHEIKQHMLKLESTKERISLPWKRWKSQSIQKEGNLNVSANVKQLDRIGAKLINGVRSN
ncbi:homoserine kinase [Trifolium repens]|nr:homoserine kinase [Trifolium repens]